MVTEPGGCVGVEDSSNKWLGGVAVARPSGIKETHGLIPSLALSFLLPQFFDVHF